MVAVGHSILVIIYHVLRDHKAYSELGGNYFDEHDRQATERRLVRRLEKLGYEVELKSAPPAAYAGFFRRVSKAAMSRLKFAFTEQGCSLHG
jgi:hypothetical protein